VDFFDVDRFAGDLLGFALAACDVGRLTLVVELTVFEPEGFLDSGALTDDPGLDDEAFDGETFVAAALPFDFAG
jgi:hypothetical protein